MKRSAILAGVIFVIASLSARAGEMELRRDSSPKSSLGMRYLDFGDSTLLYTRSIGKLGELVRDVDV